MRICFVLIASLSINAICFLNAASGDDLPTYFLRELVANADEIVVTLPAEAGRVVGADVRFIVSEALKGQRTHPGETITVRDLSFYHLGRPPFGRRPADAQPPVCTKALLFLNPKRTDREQQKAARQFELYTSGIRLLTDDANVLLPMQFMNPGDYYVEVAKNTNWKKLLTKLKDDINVVNAVFALKDIADPAQRNQAIFDWIDRHRSEFNGLYFVGNNQSPERGWGSLEHRVFEWILDGGRPDDAWRAVKVWRKVAKHPFGVGPLGRPETFASSEGRRILLHAAMDGEEPIEDRQSAVYRLAMSLYNKPPEPRQITREEHRELNVAALGLLKHDDGQLRRFASKLARGLELQKASLGIDPRPRETLDAMIEAYRRQEPGYIRKEMAAAILDVGGEDVWRQISGNPDRILIDLRNVQVRRKGRRKVISFTIYQSLHRRKDDLFQAGRPVAVLEKVDLPEPGERHRLPLLSLESASSGDSGPWVAEVRAEGLSPGRWRLNVVGKVSVGDADKWRSEPAEVDVE